MSDKVTLKVNGRNFEGWKAVRIVQGLDGLAGTFSIALSKRWPGQPTEWGIKDGDACELFIGSDQVMSAWIDRLSISIDPERHPVEVVGRERTCDLVDCSAIHKPGSWKSRTLEQIVAELVKPFGIKVSAAVSTGRAFDKVALQQAETVFEVIDRLARQRGVFPVTTTSGDMEFRRPGQTAAGYALEEGVNLKHASYDSDATERFSDYTLKAGVTDGKSQPKAEAKDPGVTRYRPLLIVNDDEGSTGNLADRAKWEASVRAAKGQAVSAEVVGWRASNGELFRPDRLVPIKAVSCGVDTTLLVVSVAFELSERGRLTTLSLAPKEAYQLEPIAAPKGKGAGA